MRVAELRNIDSPIEPQYCCTMTMKREQWKTIGQIVFVVACVALLIFLITWTPAAEEEPYATTTVEQRDIERTIQGTGVIVTRHIDDEDQPVVQWFVTEDEVDTVAVDHAADLTIDALEVDTSGTIHSIADEPRLSGDTTEYEVITTLTDQPDNVRNGLHVDVTVVLETKNDVIAVPNESLSQTDGDWSVTLITEQRRVYLKRLRIDKTVQAAQRQDVEIGFEGDDYTEITAGLSVGDVIVAE